MWGAIVQAHTELFFYISLQHRFIALCYSVYNSMAKPVAQVGFLVQVFDRNLDQKCFYIYSLFDSKIG
jgi:hypothetical protein